ncbi:DUF6526 family protein [Granulicella sp. S190]|uniref:DUF6526 family protein n=1 Tax=Granulicella sp. S190 TaxID=1747226 RepID=UPI00131D4B53|nr:DUF6526 family protein [Granulicella sp. S190]
MPATQTFKSHTRYYPLFHFIIVPLLLLNFIFSIYITIHSWPGWQHTHLWGIVMALVLFMIAGVARGSAIKAQDRVIRLEERLRLAALLPAADRAHIDEFTVPQLIALRFASDAELPDLAHRALTKNMAPKAIKEAIVTWRPDHHRV